MKRIVSFLFVLLFVFSIASCSKKSTVSEGIRDSTPISGSVMEKSVSQETKNDSNYGKPSSPGVIATIPTEKSKKIIKRATVQISVEDPEKTMDEISKEVEKLKGYISNSNKTFIANRIDAKMQIKIPTITLVPFLKFLQTLGKEEEEVVSSEEITKEYYDIESRLVNAMNQMKQLGVIMSKAQKIPDLLEVQRQIDSVQERIEQFKGQIRLWDQLVDLSTVDIIILQTEIAQTVEKKTYWTLLSWKQLGNEMKKSWIKFADGIGRLLQSILISLPTLLILALIVLLVLWIIRKNLRYQKKSSLKK